MGDTRRGGWFCPIRRRRWLIGLALGWMGLCLLAGARAQGGDPEAAAVLAPEQLAPPAAVVRLDEAERRWLAEHRVVRVALSSGFPPYYFFDEPAADAARPAAARVPGVPTALPHGFVVELMDLWAQRTGVRFEYQRHATLEQATAAVAAGEADMTPFTLPRPDSETRLIATRPAFSTQLVLAARRDVPDVSPSGNFGGRRVAIEEGSSLLPLLRVRYPQALLQSHADPERALRAVSTGAADLYVGYLHVVVYHVEKHLLANLELRSNLGPGALPLGPAVRADAPALRSLLDKAIASVTSADRSRLAARWLPAGSQAVRLPQESAVLSEAERGWVQGNGRLRVGYDASFAPITLRGDLGDFRGLGADALRLVAGKVGLEIEQERGASFADVYAEGVEGKLDVVVGMVRTPQRRLDYDFVGPFISLATALVTRTDEGRLVASTADIGNRKLALLRAHFLIPQLRARHPGIRLIEVDRQDQVLSAVAEGAADVGLGNIQVISSLIERRYASSVRISGIVQDGDSELYFAVPRRLPELTRVLRSGLDAVNDSEMAELRARWLATQVPTGLSWTEVLRVAVPVLGVLLGYLYLLKRGNRRLRAARAREQAARQLAEDSTAARGRFLAYLSHELRGGLAALRSGTEMLRHRDDPQLRERLLGAMAQSSDGLLQVLDTTLAYEQTEQGRWTPQPQPTDLAAWWEQVLAPGRLAAQRKGLVFDARWRGPAPIVPLDATRLQQVVQNLVGNAVKFTPVGRVAVTGELRPGPRARAHERLLWIEVRDAGPGLSEADRQRLFQPYAQGDQGRAANQGAGLGLAICRQLMQGLGGQIVLDSPPGAGAVFTLTLPVTPVAAAPAEAPEEEDVAAVG